MTQPLLNPVKSTKYRMTVVFGCIVCTALVGLLDYATGVDLRSIHFTTCPSRWVHSVYPGTSVWDSL